MSAVELADTSHGTRLVLVRHGESLVTVDRIIGGRRSCRGLSDLGRRQAAALGERWRREGYTADVLFSSDFPRAIETAQLVHSSIGGVDSAGIVEWSGFGEHDPGPDIDGMSFADYVDRFGTPDWNGDPNVEIFPGGETTTTFHRRVAGALAELLRHHDEQHVVLACHGGVIDAVTRQLLGLDVTGGAEFQALNTSITEFSALGDGRWRLERYNDSAHLAGLPERTPRSVDRT